MTRHQVMDRTGHSEHVFDRADRISVREAEKRFVDLTKRGFTAVVPGENGEPGEIVKTFDPGADVLFVPALQGG